MGKYLFALGCCVAVAIIGFEIEYLIKEIEDIKDAVQELQQQFN